jgi:hypothetical protein
LQATSTQGSTQNPSQRRLSLSHTTAMSVLLNKEKYFNLITVNIKNHKTHFTSLVHKILVTKFV